MALIVVIVLTIGSYQFPKVSQSVNQVLGAVPTLDGVDNPFVTINGHKWWVGRQQMVATSSVLCSIKNPLGATSSIDFIGAEVTARGGIGAANNLSISTSTSQFATSSTALVHNYAMGTGQFSMAFQKNSATTSVTNVILGGVPVAVLPGLTTAGASNYILGPSEYVQWVISTTTPGGGSAFTTYMTGQCSLNLKKI